VPHWARTRSGPGGIRRSGSSPWCGSTSAARSWKSSRPSAPDESAVFSRKGLVSGSSGARRTDIFGRHGRRTKNSRAPCGIAEIEGVSTHSRLQIPAKYSVRRFVQQDTSVDAEGAHARSYVRRVGRRSQYAHCKVESALVGCTAHASARTLARVEPDELAKKRIGTRRARRATRRRKNGKGMRDPMLAIRATPPES